MDLNTDFLSLLLHLKGDQFVDILIDHQIDKDSLRYMSTHHLDAIIPKTLYGPRIIFEHHLKKWQKEVNCSDVEDPIHLSVSELAETSIASTFIDLFSNSDLEEISLEDILKGSPSGKQVMSYYEKHKVLSQKYRILLTNCITSFLIEQKTKPSPRNFEILAEQISKVFSSENKDIYYVPIKGRKPAGSLYSKYHNSIAKLRKEGIYEPSSSSKKIEVANIIEDICLPDDIQICNKSWLMYNIEPMEEVLQKWENTYSVRRSFIKGHHSLHDIFEEWPLLKQSFGYKLIAADFTKIFPEISNKLFERWEVFCNSVFNLLYKNVKDPDSMTLLNEFKEGDQNTEARNCLILYLMHSLLKPTIRKCTIEPATKKRKYTKTSIQDSRNAFFLIAATNFELNSKIKALIDELYKKKETLQPIICGIGSSILNLSEFFIYYGNVFYKFENVITCVDISFKIFNVLNLKYPENCKLVWLFIQQYFYDIDIKNSEKTTILTSTLNDIKNINI